MGNASRSGAQTLPARGKSAQPAQNHRSAPDHPLRTGITATGIPSRPLPWGASLRGENTEVETITGCKKNASSLAREPQELVHYPRRGTTRRFSPARTEWTLNSFVGSAGGSSLRAGEQREVLIPRDLGVGANPARGNNLDDRHTTINEMGPDHPRAQGNNWAPCQDRRRLRTIPARRKTTTDGWASGASESGPSLRAGKQPSPLSIWIEAIFLASARPPSGIRAPPFSLELLKNLSRGPVAARVTGRPARVATRPVRNPKRIIPYALGVAMPRSWSAGHLCATVPSLRAR